MVLYYFFPNENHSLHAQVFRARFLMNSEGNGLMLWDFPDGIPVWRHAFQAEISRFLIQRDSLFQNVDDRRETGRLNERGM